MTITRVLVWIAAGGWRKLAAGVAVIAVGWLAWAIWDAGYQTAEQACDSAAAKAKIEKLEREAKTAGAIATSAQATATKLAARDQSAQEQLRDLTAEIERLRAAVKPGGPGLVGHHPRDDPLLDDRCGLTARGLHVLDGR